MAPLTLLERKAGIVTEPSYAHPPISREKWNRNAVFACHAMVGGPRFQVSHSYCTVTVTVCVCMTEPDAAFTVIVYVPAGVPLEPFILLLPPAHAICSPKPAINSVVSKAARVTFFLLPSLARLGKNAIPQMGSHSAYSGRKSGRNLG